VAQLKAMSAAQRPASSTRCGRLEQPGGRDIASSAYAIQREIFGMVEARL